MDKLDNIQLSQFNRAYFIGIGGIGMSALARYFNAIGWEVAGYDKTPSPLTDELQNEGIKVHFEDLGPSIPAQFKVKEQTLVIYTPAIPKNLGELLFFQHAEAQLFKRSEVLGLLTRQSKGLGVAGTHGKTTTSSMLAHILNESQLKCNAFLGGIATNFNSNLVLNPMSQYTVIEADEFDRSFLKLTPFASIITSTDPDHLDIYGDASVFLEGFQMYAQLIQSEGCLVKKEGLEVSSKATTISYAIESKTADYSGNDLRFIEGEFLMNVRTPNGVMANVQLGIPGIHNAENAVACIALTEFLGLSEEEIRLGLSSFLGVKRRFEYKIKTADLVYIDDYAHHPTEIHALVSSVRLLYPGKKITGVFQPHLFSRTRDFFDGFAEELSAMDEVILLPIYPAREEPIAGVTSDVLLEKISAPSKMLLSPSEALGYLSKIESGVVLTIGAGDIDRIVEPLKNALI
jgi:UDP-N-acetylmuramate--alanine ligase